MHSDLLCELPRGACSPARQWLLNLAEAGATPQQAWEQCPRGDWLLWFAARRNVDRRRLVRAHVVCLAPILFVFPEGERRAHRVIETVTRWTHGDATDLDVKTAMNDFRGGQTDYSPAVETARQAVKQVGYICFDPDVRIYAGDVAYLVANLMADVAFNARTSELGMRSRAWQSDTGALSDSDFEAWEAVEEHAAEAGKAARAVLNETYARLATLVRSVIPEVPDASG